MQPETESRKTVLSLIQPTGTPTLGNYLGALKNWAAVSNDYDCIYGVADLHSITVPTFRENPAQLRKNTLDLYALLIALGIDPEKNILFVQSQVPTHAQLAWILNCYTQYGEASRMTQFKDKSARYGANVSVGLFDYPVLMAADILIYGADYVPIGADQKQHLELARNICDRFNGIYGPVLKMPEPLIGKAGAKICSLQDPLKKMSKSDDNPKAYVSMLDEPNVIMKKIKSAVTDSEAEVCCREGKDGVNNLMAIYSCCTGKTNEEIEAEFRGKGYGDFKTAVGEAVCATLEPIQQRYRELITDKAYLEGCMARGAEAATRLSQRTLSKVMKKVGFYPPARG